MMETELVKVWLDIIDTVFWPIAIIVILVILWGYISSAKQHGINIRVKLKDLLEFSVEPAQGYRPPSGITEGDQSQLFMDVEQPIYPTTETLPLDCFFLNHTSYYKEERQAQYRANTGLPYKLFNIQVIVDSYYKGALEKIKYVEYVLHSSYKDRNIQVKSDKKNKFLLKELAYGEYILMAKVFLKDRNEPVLLQRYISLWETGPRLS